MITGNQTKKAIKEGKKKKGTAKKNAVRKRRKKKWKKVIEVEGMMCAHCQMHVQKALAAVEGVSEAAVDLEAKKRWLSSHRRCPMKRL